jgi:putative flippase GtrA
MTELKLPTSASEIVSLIRTLFGRRVVRFLTVGGSCAVIQLSILHVLVVSGIEVHLANLIAFMISMEINFALNQAFTWRDRWSSSLSAGRIIGRLALFNVAAALTAGVINQGTFALVNLFTSYLVAGAAGIVVAAGANFLLNDKVVFNLWSSRTRPAGATEPQR